MFEILRNDGTYVPGKRLIKMYYHNVCLEPGWLFSYTTKAYYFCGKLPRTTYKSINLVCSLLMNYAPQLKVKRY